MFMSCEADRPWFEETCRCPVCLGPLEILAVTEDPACPACAKSFPLTGGIPVLVGDPESHLAMIRNQAVQKPNWYRGDQVRYYDEGPYRDHLRKRREYVLGVLTKLTADLNRPLQSVRLLDLGCGDGPNLRWLEPLGTGLYATDYNLERLVRAKSALPDRIRFFLSDIGRLPLADNHFDLIYFNHVLEHIPDDQGALNQIFRITAPGGHVILGAPNEGSLWWQLAYNLEPDTKTKSDHCHFYTGESLKRLCEKTGFRVLELKYLGYGLPHWTADSVFRNIQGVDDLMDQLGAKFFPDQASSIYLILRKETV